MSDSKSSIRAFFFRFFNADEISDNDDIFAGGYVNSLFAMQLIAWLEKEFDITIGDDDLQLVNFSSINAISDLIARKRNVEAAA